MSYSLLNGKLVPREEALRHYLSKETKAGAEAKAKADADIKAEEEAKAKAEKKEEDSPDFSQMSNADLKAFLKEKNIKHESNANNKALVELAESASDAASSDYGITD